MTERSKGPDYGSIGFLEARLHVYAEQVSIVSVEQSVGSASIQSRLQFHLLVTVNQRDGYQDSGGGLQIAMPEFEFERNQSSHPPAKGSSSSGEM